MVRDNVYRRHPQYIEGNDMARRRKIEVFTAGCWVCAEAVELVKFLAGANHDVEIRDMHDDAVAEVASGYGVCCLPAIVVDGQLVDCAWRGADEEILTEAIAG